MTSEATLPVRWMAPESLMDGVFSAKSDVWQLGVAMWELLSREMPHAGMPNSVVVRRVANGHVLTAPEGTPEWLDNLLHRCW